MSRRLLQPGTFLLWSFIVLCTTVQQGQVRSCVVEYACMNKAKVSVTCYKCCKGFIEDNNKTCVREILSSTTLETTGGGNVTTESKGLILTTSAYNNSIGPDIITSRNNDKETRDIDDITRTVNATEISSSSRSITTTVHNRTKPNVNSTDSTVTSQTDISILTASHNYKKYLLIVAPIAAVSLVLVVALLILIVFLISKRKRTNQSLKLANKKCCTGQVYPIGKFIDLESSVVATEISRNSTNSYTNVFEPVRDSSYEMLHTYSNTELRPHDYEVLTHSKKEAKTS